MSKNFPHDNIYSILGKLESLTPKVETKEVQPKKIYESVEARGSVIEGVSKIESALAEKYMGFKKTVAAIKKGGSAEDPEAVAAAIGRKKYGKAAFQKAAAAGKKMGEEAVEESGLQYYTGKKKYGKDGMAALAKAGREGANQEELGRIKDKYIKKEETEVAEVAPPGEKAERMVKHIKKGYAKDGKLTPKEKSIAYATAWKAHKAGKVEEADDHKETKLIRDLRAQGLSDKEIVRKMKELKHGTTKTVAKEADMEEAVCSECGMAEGTCSHSKMREAKVNPTAELVKKIRARLSQLHDQMEPEEAYDQVADEFKISTGKLERLLQDERFFEAEANEGKVEPTRHGIRHHADPGRYGGYDPETDPDKDDDTAASTEKRGRGRPKKAEKEKSQASLPWGGKPPKDTYKHQKGAYVHKISESRMIDEAGEALEHILNRFKAEVRNFEQGGDLDKDLYDALYDYYLDRGEIPYGVAKARTGDPMKWVGDALYNHLSPKGITGNVPLPGKMDRLKAGRDYYEEDIAAMENELKELARLAGLDEVSRGEYIKQQDAKAERAGKDKFSAFGQEFDTDEIKEVSRGEYIKQQDAQAEKSGKDSFKAFGQTFSTDEVDEQAKPDYVDLDKDGNKTEPMKKAAKDAKELDESIMSESTAGDTSDFNITTTMNARGDKNVTVTATGDHAAELLQMLRIAGLGDSGKAQELTPQVMVIDEPKQEEMADEGIEVAEPDQEAVNAPKPEYKTMRQSTLNPGEGDFGEKAQHPDKPTWKNGDNPLAKPTMEEVLQLEARLAAEYESIKKVQ